MKTNYHTHTERCRHAVGSDEQFVLAAIENGFQVLGMSDHAPYPYHNGYIAGYRMQPADREEYIASFRALGKQYQEQIHLHVGFECEPLPDYFGYLGELKAQCDYLIMGNHGDESNPGYIFAGQYTEKEQVRNYARTAIRGMETGLFAYIAHPDLALGWYPIFDDTAKDMSLQIARAAKALNMPLEYNLTGCEKQRNDPRGLGYPCRRFWEMAAEEGCTAIVGVDAHVLPAFAWKDYEEGKAWLKSLGMQVIDTLPGLA